METPLAGKVALVTGARSGIGRALALMLGQEGARLALAARSAERLEAVRDATIRDLVILPQNQDI